MKAVEAFLLYLLKPEINLCREAGRCIVRWMIIWELPREGKEGIVPKLCIKILEKVSPLTPSSSILR